MKTKVQKTQDIKKATELFEGSKSIVFVDFSKTPTREIGILKNALAVIESTYKVIKKRLLGIVFKQKNIDIDIAQFESQLGTVFSSHDIVDAAGTVYRFAKGKEKELPEFKMIGGYDVLTSKFYSADEMKRLGQLPTREILLGQLVGMVQAPLRTLAYVLDQISKNPNH